jgi:hypothetical protein
VALEYLFLFDQEKQKTLNPRIRKVLDEALKNAHSQAPTYEVKKHDPITGAKCFSHRVEFPCL